MRPVIRPCSQSTICSRDSARFTRKVMFLILKLEKYAQVLRQHNVLIKQDLTAGNAQFLLLVTTQQVIALTDPDINLVRKAVAIADEIGFHLVFAFGFSWLDAHVADQMARAAPWILRPMGERLHLFDAPAQSPFIIVK